MPASGFLGNISKNGTLKTRKNKDMKKMLILLPLLCCAIDIRAANTLKVINDVPASVADPTNVFIQLNYATASINPALTKFEVVYPFTENNSVWTLEITSINAGNLKFGIDPTHNMEQYSKAQDPDVHLIYDGLFEFTLLSTDTVGYWDISNVDWIGMLCSVKCTAGGYPDATWQLGYYKKASELISMITNEYQFTPAQADQVLIHSNAWPSGWAKLIAPNHEVTPYVDSQGGKSHLVDYLYSLESNSVPLCLKANLPSTDTGHFTGPNPPGWQERVAALGSAPAAFTGKFQCSAPVDDPSLPGPGLTNQIVLVLSNAACGTVLYYSTDGINPGTTYQNDSSGGLWVRYCTDINAGTWQWVMTNRHLNCVTPDNPSLFEDWVASLANKICYSLNAGLIPTNSNPANVFTFSGNDALVPAETNTWKYPPYEVNMYNNVIVNNSDSYGMGYSDANPLGVKKVVMQTLKDGGVVELHLLDPSGDPDPVDETVPLAADFDGDAKADPAVYNTNSNWKIKLSSANYTLVPLTGFLGGSGYSALAADFDGDRRADPGVYQETTGAWIIKLSSAGYEAVPLDNFLGGAGYAALAADFDGDAKADPAVYQEATGTWKIKLSSIRYTEIPLSGFMGGTGWTAMAADFDGDAKADPTVYQATTESWEVLLSSSGFRVHALVTSFLGGTDYAAFAADFDGDAKADPAAAETNTGHWKIRLSSGNYVLVDLLNFLGE